MKGHLAISNALAGRLVIVCGPGGVGKTTTSAALALAAASRGKKTLVCTIDPSRRLRTSLGLARLTGTPQKVKGRLFAMRLDPKQTFDSLVKNHAATPEARDRVLSNRFYRQISGHLAGTHEVMAMEGLMSVACDFDLIVLDTPPASSALAFLDAPKRVLDFVDGRILRYFLKPYFVAGRLALEPKTLVGRSLLRILDGAVGLQFLQDLSEFFLAFEGLFESFRKTANAMDARLREEGTSFILVTTPASSRVNEGAAFAEALRARSLKATLVIANRVHPWAIEGAVRGRVEEAADGADVADGPFEGRPRSNHRSLLTPEVFAELSALAKREKARADLDVRQLRQIGSKSGLTVITVPELPADVHDLPALKIIAGWLSQGLAAS